MQILLDFPCCFFLDSHFGLYRHGKHAKSEQHNPHTNTPYESIKIL